MIRNRILVLVLSYTVTFPIFAAGEIQRLPSDFIEVSKLQKELNAYCLEQPVLDMPLPTAVIDSASRQFRDIHFQSVRFKMGKKGVTGQPDCLAEREIVGVFDQGKKPGILFDSGFYPEPYCDNPVRYSQPPIIYEMRDQGNDNSTRRKLAVIEFISATLPCPDIEESRSRRYMFFDLEDSNKLLLDIQADFIIPEIGDYTYRVHLIGVKKVLKTSIEIRPGQLPSAIELKKQLFSISLTASVANKNPVSPPAEISAGERVRLNPVYSKDKTHVYYQTADTAGQIVGADPKTFELLNATGESAFTRDAGRVYFFGEPVPAADPKTFKQMSERYGKDINHVFFMRSILPKADVASFYAPYTNVWYARDKDHVFSGARIFELADPQTFSTGEDRLCGNDCSYRSEDKNYRFDAGDKIVQKTISLK